MSPTSMRRGLMATGVIALVAVVSWVTWNLCCVRPSFNATACATGDGRRVGFLTAAGLLVIDARSGAILAREELRGSDAVVACGRAGVAQIEFETRVHRPDSKWSWDRTGPAIFDESPARAAPGTHLLLWREMEAHGGGRVGHGGSPAQPLRTLLQLRNSGGRGPEHVIPTGEIVIDADETGRALVGNPGHELAWQDLRTARRQAAALGPGPCELPARVSADGTRAVWLCIETLGMTDGRSGRLLFERQLTRGTFPGTATISADGRRAYVVNRLDFPRTALLGVRDDGTVILEVDLPQLTLVVIPLPERDVVVLQDEEVARLSDDGATELWRVRPDPT